MSNTRTTDALIRFAVQARNATSDVDVVASGGGGGGGEGEEMRSKWREKCGKITDEEVLLRVSRHHNLLARSRKSTTYSIAPRIRSIPRSLQDL